MFQLVFGCHVKPRSKPQTILEMFAEMPDGHLWQTKNLSVEVKSSYCFNDNTTYCDLYGRLYTWAAAKEACQSLGDDWRLPTDEEWLGLADQFGGIVTKSEDNGKSAYLNLLDGGNSNFNAQLGGNRESNGSYERLGAHGFYWTATEYDSAQAWFINFAKGSILINHHTGEKQQAVSVRCIKTKLK